MTVSKINYALGDHVSWESQAGGCRTTKKGIVVRILWEGCIPVGIAKDEFPGHRRMFDGLSIPQGEPKAYLVQVDGGKTDRAKPLLYMPRPKQLRPA